MSDKDNGGSAFPIIDGLSSDRDNGYTTYGDGGMSLRDYFAAHAPIPNQFLSLEAHCTYRYAYADAMIKERNK